MYVCVCACVCERERGGGGVGFASSLTVLSPPPHPTTTTQYSRNDVPCSWTALTANGLDASHLDFAHTSVIGDKNGPFAGVVTHASVKDGDAAAAAGRPFGAAASVRAMATAAATGDASMHGVTFPLPDRDESVRGKNMATQRIAFEPPTLVTWALDAPSDISRGSPWRTLAILVTPTRPGFCSVFFCMAFPKRGASLLARTIFGTMPRWKLHLRGADVFDGDVALLAPTDAAPAAVAAAAASDDYAAWTRANYVPADADEPVRALYKWLAERGGEAVAGRGDVGRPRPCCQTLLPRAPLCRAGATCPRAASAARCTPALNRWPASRAWRRCCWRQSRRARRARARARGHCRALGGGRGRHSHCVGLGSQAGGRVCQGAVQPLARVRERGG